MKYIVNLPVDFSNFDGQAVVVSGSGLDWTSELVPMTTILSEAQRNVRYDNVELHTIEPRHTLGSHSDKLIYGGKDVNDTSRTRLWVDTRPCHHSRFTSNLVTVVQEIRTEDNIPLGYVVAFPDGRVLKVAQPELLKYCENARQSGHSAVQNMKFVKAAPGFAAHLKNYDGRTIPIYIHRRKAVNAEKSTAVIPKVPVSVAEVEKPSAASIFTPEQLEVLGRGKKEGVDIKVYANPDFSPKHMDVIRNVLFYHKDPTLLLDPKMPEELVAFYGYDLANGADIRPYYNTAYTLKQANQVKLGVIRGLDVSKYASPATDGAEMEQLRVRMDADMWSGITED